MMKNLGARFRDWVKIHKIAFGAMGFIFLVALLILPKRVSQAVKGPEEKYETTKVTRRDLSQAVSASGKVSAVEQVELKFAVSGKLAWVGVKEGDRVKKYQALATLDRRELEKKLKKELNDYMNERWNFEQDYDDQNASGENLERLTLTDAVKRLLQQAQFDLDNTVLDVEIADLALELSVLTTPIEGIVTGIDTPFAGVNITPATAVFTVANPAQMEFNADVDEADIALVQPGQEVQISLDAYPEETFRGEVSQIGFAAFSTRGGGTAFSVKVFLPENDAARFRVGMNGDAEIILESKQNVLSLPSGAIAVGDDKSEVTIIEDRRIKTVEVKTGLESDSWTEITEGLDENQIVVVAEKEK